jgi:quinol monooxygenase YgiN
MITRIVKLEFQEEYLGTFLKHFEQVKWSVATFPGCHGMKLIQDVKNPCIIMTYSLWENEEALEDYRISSLFQSIWPTIKPWFSAKPEAWSLTEYFDGFQSLKYNEK